MLLFSPSCPNHDFLCGKFQPWPLLRLLPEISQWDKTRFSNQTSSFSVKHHSLYCHLIPVSPHRTVKPNVPEWERHISSFQHFNSLFSQGHTDLQMTARVQAQKRRGEGFYSFPIGYVGCAVCLLTTTKLNLGLNFIPLEDDSNRLEINYKQVKQH